MNQVERLIQLANRESEDASVPVRIARTGAEIRQAAKEGTLALVYAVEGGHVLRSDESNVDRLAALGVRYLTIVHFVHNRIGGRRLFLLGCGPAVLGLWVIAIVAIVAAILYLPGPALVNVGSAAGGWVLGLPVLAAAIIGALMSCVSLGWYMAVSVSFNGHNSEAGGAARIGDFKQMVQFRITKDELTGFVIGFDRPQMNGTDLELKLIDVFRIRP